MAASTMPVGGGARADPGGRTPARRPQDWEPARAGGRCSPRGAPGGGALPPAVREIRVGPNPGVTARAPQPRPARPRGSGLTPASLCLCGQGQRGVSPVSWPSGYEPGLRSPGPFGGWAGWEEPSGKFPSVEMASVVRVSRALTQRSSLPWVAGQLGWRCSRGLVALPSTSHPPTRGWPWGPSCSEARELSEATRELDRKRSPSCPQRAGLTS